MRAIRFVQVGNKHGGLLHNLVLTLNSLQSEFRFYYADDVIPEPSDASRDSQDVAAEIDACVAEYMRRTFRYDYPIAVCSCPLEDEDFASYDDLGALISTHDWERDCAPYSLRDGIVYAIADILLDISITSAAARIPIHSEALACPSDLCGNRGDMVAGLDRCDYCPSCRSRIVRALSQGYVSPAQVAAAYKLLDFVAGRRSSFVLMPFSQALDATYTEYVKPAMIANGWQCERADEMYETRDIISLIVEKILRADLLIADLTGRNTNVFYELGVAHANGKDTILLTQSIKDVPFDLRTRRLIEYAPTPEGHERMVQDLLSYAPVVGDSSSPKARRDSQLMTTSGEDATPPRRRTSGSSRRGARKRSSGSGGSTPPGS